MARTVLIRRLAGTRWGASTPTLRTSTLALVYAPAEYCAQLPVLAEIAPPALRLEAATLVLSRRACQHDHLLHDAMENFTHRKRLKGALYRIWCGVNRLGDSGLKVV